MYKKSVTKIRLLKDLSQLEFVLSRLRFAKKAGDVECVNNTQIGRMNENSIEYEKIV